MNTNVFECIAMSPIDALLVLTETIECVEPRLKERGLRTAHYAVWIGYAILDQDALETLEQAAPLTLKQPLGQPQIVVHIPISYKLDR